MKDGIIRSSVSHAADGVPLRCTPAGEKHVQIKYQIDILSDSERKLS